MAQHWMLLGSFVIFQGVWTSIAKEPYSFVTFQGGQDPVSPHSGQHMITPTIWKEGTFLLGQSF